MEAEAAGGWNSEQTSLNRFTYPVPETRFFHAGLNIYKFKIKYGNTVSTNVGLHENIINEELEEAIRVILGNLNNLCPFTTEHLVVFPYLDKWEKVSDLRFKRGDAFLSPCPYVCIVYTEVRSRQKRLFLDKSEYRDPFNFVDNTSKLTVNVGTESAMKWRRQECTAEISHAQLSVDRNVARGAAYICGAARPHVGRTRLQKDVMYLRENLPEEIQLQYFGAAILNHGSDNMPLALCFHHFCSTF
ncbi:membrane-anchored junction protein isoform X2 [Sphaerodactylus townsendi]|uniref:membrane-anchored junction protein isoform X2 n=1 Tax=Sphaerodactylus townsendi TaxID=933632 RepID=UPI002025D36A|nr:membrane-anchored junction protein isoform X2 [Sphaerodactylus townsendi]